MTDPETEIPIPSPENPFRNVKYIAEATGYKEFTVREWLRDGKLKGYQDTDARNEWRILHSDFVEFCQKKWGA